MKTRHLFLTAILAFLALSAVQADTPELINYQGRLTNPDGSPQAGTKTFSLSIWDDATGGAALYSEDLGEVLLDENGIYSFQFGADSAALAQAVSPPLPSCAALALAPALALDASPSPSPSPALAPGLREHDALRVGVPVGHRGRQ